MTGTTKPLPLLAAALLLAAGGCTKERPAEDESAGAAAGAGESESAGEPLEHELDEEARALIFESEIDTLEGELSSLARLEGKALLLVNVASECGLTPQYEGLQRLQEEYGDRGFSVAGFPCNQFGEQEPGSAEEIRTFCDENFGVTFPVFEKIEVNGEGRHPIYQGLTRFSDAGGEAGDVEWNFEKFVISADRERIARFRPKTEPEDPKVVAAIEAALP